MSDEVRYLPAERLWEFSARVFGHFGVPPSDAAQTANVLAATDLRGVDSHGVARLRKYFDMLTLGRIIPSSAGRFWYTPAMTARSSSGSPRRANGQLRAAYLQQRGGCQSHSPYYSRSNCSQ